MQFQCLINIKKKKKGKLESAGIEELPRIYEEVVVVVVVRTKPPKKAYFWISSIVGE